MKEVNLRKMVLFFLILVITSCEKEGIQPMVLSDANQMAQEKMEEPGNPETSGEAAPPVSLKFTLQTEEDQMGEFRGNRMVVFKGKVWSVGGRNAYSDGQATSDVWVSDNGKNWVSVTSGQFEARRGHTLTVFQEKMWLIGGYTNDDEFLGDVWHTSDGVSWINTTLSASFGSISEHSAVVFDNKLFVLFLNDIWSTVDGSLWVRETTSPFPFRQHYKTVVFQDELFIIAGIGSPHSSPHNEIWKSNDGINWSEVTTVSIFPPRVQHAATVYNDKVWVIGGYPEHGASTPTQHSDVWYTNDMEVWREFEGVVPIESFSEQGNLVFNGSLWHFGGYKAHPFYETLSEIWSFKEE